MAGNLEIKVSDDSYEIFKATRMIHCQAFDCKNNAADERWGGHVDCRLKRIYMLKGGQCEQYEPKAEE